MAWWTAGGATGCVAAYEPIGAPDQASSYVNRAAPGTDDAVAVVAPAWSTLTGWAFAGTQGGTMQRLTGPTITARPVTIILRVTVDASGRGAWVKWGGDDTKGVALGRGNGTFDSLGTDVVILRESLAWESTGQSASSTEDVWALAMTTSAGTKLYRNGSLVSTKGNGNNPTTPIHIGGYNVGGSNRFSDSTIGAVAIYDAELDDAEVAAVSAAMAALPTGGSWGGGAVAVILAQMRHWHAVAGGG